LEYAYIKICTKRQKTPIAYKDKMGKSSKLLKTITFRSELRFEKMNSFQKGIEERNHLSRKHLD
jgi:hypothetical protein